MSQLPSQSAFASLDTDKSVTKKFDDLLLIGELAEIVSVAPSAIRFYEKQGLLKPRKLGRLRMYSTAEAENLKVIVRLRKTGLPINRIREVIELLKQSSADGNSVNLTAYMEKQVEELVRLSEVLGEQMHNAMMLLRELEVESPHNFKSLLVQ